MKDLKSFIFPLVCVFTFQVGNVILKSLTSTNFFGQQLKVGGYDMDDVAIVSSIGLLIFMITLVCKVVLGGVLVLVTTFLYSESPINENHAATKGGEGDEEKLNGEREKFLEVGRTNKSLSEEFEISANATLQKMTLIRLKEELSVRKISFSGQKKKSEYIHLFLEYLIRIGHLDGLDKRQT